MSMSRPILCEKAKQFNEQLHAEEATSHQSQRVLVGYVIDMVFVAAFGEKLSADIDTQEPFEKQLQNVSECEMLTLKQIYNF